MRENDEITGLFRSRLAGAEMTVREDFWEGLQRDLPSPVAAKGRRPLFLSPRFHRVAAAAAAQPLRSLDHRLCCICTGSCFCRFLVFLSERGNQGGLYTSGGHDAGR